MPARVNLEAAGDHQFDMSHLTRSGAEELVELLLEKAGLNQNLWRVRVNKKQPCSGMTTPISVVRCNEWGIYIRMKPGDNNTCHNVTLIVPAGLKVNKVFPRLKALEKSFNRNWKKIPVSTMVGVIS